MVRFLAFFSCVWALGCGEPRTLGRGTCAHVWKSYPFDGVRTWVYRSTDPILDYELVATSDGEPEGLDNAEIYPISFHRRCAQDAADCTDGELVQAISWSSGPRDGVAVHTIDAGAGPVAVEPPVVLAEYYGGCDGIIATTTEAHGEWVVARPEPIVPCPNTLGGVRRQDCIVLDVETTAEDGRPLAGTWWSAYAIGVVAFQRAGEAAVWEMVESNCTGECDGEW